MKKRETPGSRQRSSLRDNTHKVRAMEIESIRQYRYRDRVSGNSRLLNDYFVENPVYDEILFRRRFRLSRPLFMRILHTLQQHNNYFVQRRNAANTVGLSGEQKMTAALRMLAYGMSADSIDEYVRIGETTTIECVKRFCQGVVEIFGPKYLRSPNAADIIRLLRKANQRGFPGMCLTVALLYGSWSESRDTGVSLVSS